MGLCRICCFGLLENVSVWVEMMGNVTDVREEVVLLSVALDLRPWTKSENPARALMVDVSSTTFKGSILVSSVRLSPGPITCWPNNRTKFA